MRNRYLLFILSAAIIFSGCTTTFAGTILLLNFRDLILYVIIGFVLAVVAAFLASPESKRKTFWLWFILGLICTPLASFIYLLVRVTKK